MRLSDAESQYNSMQLYAHQAPRRLAVHRVVHAGQGDSPTPAATATTTRRRPPAICSYFARAGVVRSPSRVRQHAHLPGAVAARPRRPARGAGRRLGSQQQVPLPVGPVLHGDRQLVDRQPPRRVRRRRDRHRRRRDEVVQHRRVRQPAGRSARHGDRRPDRGPSRSSRWTCRSARTSASAAATT